MCGKIMFKVVQNTQEGGDILTADAYCYMAETNTTL